MPPVNLILHPVSSACNLRCVYCYSNRNGKRAAPYYGVMSHKVLAAALKKSFDFCGNKIAIVFSGGEPAMAGLDFYKTAMEYINELNQGKKAQVKLFFRTNGALLDERWADFFKKHKFTVELSIDGYKEINDLNRFDEKGGGSFTAAMKTRDLLTSRRVICRGIFVVNRLTAKHGEKIYQFFKKSNFSEIGFSPCFESGDKRGKSFYSLTPELYGSFLKTFFGKWKEDLLRGEGISVSHFDNWTAMMFGYPADCCYQNGVCDGKFLIEGDGSVHPCYLFIDGGGLGNIMETGLEEISRSRSYTGFIEESFNICEKCKNCRFFKICRSGCKGDRLFSPKEQGYINYFCPGYYEFFKWAIDGFAQVAYMLENTTNKLI